MVRIYDYDIPQDEVLLQCQKALTELGYEIELYAPLDYHLVTRTATAKKLLRKVHYVVYVKVQDRITVYVYAEARTFKRASEMGIRVGELTELGTTRNLGVHFQAEIFDPITAEFERKGFVSWDPAEDNRLDDLDILASERRDLREQYEREELEKQKEKTEWEGRVGEYTTERDNSRYEAAIEAEHYVTVMKRELFPLKDWSLIDISKTVAENEDSLGKVLKGVLAELPSYSGKGRAQWVVRQDGRVVDASVSVDSSPHTPDDEISYGISNVFRRMIFLPTGPRFGYLILTLEFSFSGEYHNLKYRFKRPRISGLVEDFPLADEATIHDTFFEK